MPRGLMGGYAHRSDRRLSTASAVGCAHEGDKGLCSQGNWGLSTGLTGICAPGGAEEGAVPTGAQAGVGVDAHSCSEAPCRGVGVRGTALMPVADFARRWKQWRARCGPVPVPLLPPTPRCVPLIPAPPHPHVPPRPPAPGAAHSAPAPAPAPPPWPSLPPPSLTPRPCSTPP